MRPLILERSVRQLCPLELTDEPQQQDLRMTIFFKGQKNHTQKSDFLKNPPPRGKFWDGF